MSKKHFPLFRLTLLSSAVLTLGIPVDAAASPFANFPLHMSGLIANKTKPNVLLILDNSGSMQGIPETEYIYPTSNHAKALCDNRGGKFRISNPSIGEGQCDVGRTRPDYYYFCSDSGQGSAYVRENGRFVLRKYTDFQTCREKNRLSRFDVLKMTVNDLMDDPANVNVRWGLAYINNAEVNKADKVSIGSNNHQNVKQSINKVVANGGTPLTEAYVNSIYENYVINNNIEYRCQPNFAIALTDGEANGSPRQINQAADLWLKTNWLASHEKGLNYENWISSPYPYVEFNSRLGLQTPAKIFAQTDLRISGVDNEGEDWNDQAFSGGKQTVSTSTVGFGVDNDYLKRGAQGVGGAYYTASNATELADALKNALRAANTAGQGFASVAPSVNASSSTNFGAISLSLNLDKGSSTLKMMNLARNSSKELRATIDESSQLVNYGVMTDNGAESSRRVLISHANTAPKFLTKDDINWVEVTNSSTPTKQQYKDWIVRRSDKSDSDIGGNLRIRDNEDTVDRMMGDVIGSSLLQVDGNRKVPFSKYLITAANDGMLHMFLRNDNNPKKPYDLKINWIPGSANRELNHSDSTVWESMQNTTRSDYIVSTSNPHIYLLNGGISYRMTYGGQIFGVGSLGQGGKGAYAFNIGGNQHNQSKQKVGLDALPDTWPTTIPLWETANPNFAGVKDVNTYSENRKIGYTVGTPVIDRVAIRRINNKPNLTSSVRYIAAVNNGYFGTEQLPALYIYDALGQSMTYKVNDSGTAISPNTTTYNPDDAGKLLRKISVPGDVENSAPVSGMIADNGIVSMNNGLSAPALVDTDSDGLVDVAYAGDLNGNMYRFDFRKDDPSKWKASRIFKGSADNPITAAPAIYRRSQDELIVMFGTGRDIHTKDLELKIDQYFYGIYDDLRKEWCTSEAEQCQKEFTVQTRETDMLGQEIAFSSTETINGETQESRFLTNIKPQSKIRGWYIPLSKGSGERVVVQPTVVKNSVFFTTRIYQPDGGNQGAVCVRTNNTGHSWVMGVNVLTGGSLNSRTTNFMTVNSPDLQKSLAQPNRDQKLSSIPNNSVQGYYVSGLKLQGIASATEFLNLTKSDAGKEPTDGYSRNDQGQSRNGFDRDLHEINPDDEKINYCASEGTSGDLVMSDSTKPFTAFRLQNPACGLRRISWREIFF